MIDRGEHASDLELVEEYARSKSERAFAEIVSRHVNLVYSVALRHVRDGELAQDITQTVFVILSRKAHTLGPNTILAGWLCRTARFAATKAWTARQRRQTREQEAYMQSTLQEEPSDAAAAESWREIEPHLENALEQLPAKDHDALVFRYFEGQSFHDVANALGASEAGAKMRVGRAVEKLRSIFTKRGITISASLLASAVASHSVQAAPASLAGTVTLAAVKGTAVTTSTATLVESTLRYMTFLKFKTAAAIGAASLLAGGAATVTLQSADTAAKQPAISAVAAKPDYTSPEATFRTLIAALGKADHKAFAAGCTPEKAAQFNARNSTKTAEELKEEALAQAKAFSEFTIHKRETISPSEIHLWVKATGKSPKAMPGDRNGILKMKKIGDEWKFDGVQQ